MSQDGSIATVQPMVDGPYQIQGEIRLLDALGNPLADARSPLFLCRCGSSANKPFCDGSHMRTGFRSGTVIAETTSGAGSPATR